ncbi:MAG: hypothetical protein ACOYXM_04230 [Actinomycetota bacterium]
MIPFVDLTDERNTIADVSGMYQSSAAGGVIRSEPVARALSEMS